MITTEDSLLVGVYTGNFRRTIKDMIATTWTSDGCPGGFLFFAAPSLLPKATESRRSMRKKSPEPRCRLARVLVAWETGGGSCGGVSAWLALLARSATILESRLGPSRTLRLPLVRLSTDTALARTQVDSGEGRRSTPAGCSCSGLLGGRRPQSWLCRGTSRQSCTAQRCTAGFCCSSSCIWRGGTLGPTVLFILLMAANNRMSK